MSPKHHFSGAFSLLVCGGFLLLVWLVPISLNLPRPAHPSMVATFHSRDARALRGPRSVDGRVSCV